ncbi:GTPase Era [Polyangium jinanense]|uniref:GTPase Era n=1 Tax=Polyangium jinanense TaxID=2829994 RepID=A0A9X3XBC7_9BACT|nr:GTPase Era [Polyangium jinanense]MDC3962703.1 GTPase Era [Polyangium jinanense]MDC3984911.1 GTPase Era [Polyangium jinanense]
MKSRRPEPRAERPGRKPETAREKPSDDERAGASPRKEARGPRPERGPRGGRPGEETRGAKGKPRADEARGQGPGAARGKGPAKKGAPPARGGGGKGARPEARGAGARPGSPGRGGRPATTDDLTRGPRGGTGEGRRDRTAPRPRPEPRPAPEASGPSRSGTVALIGRPNVGKSTLLNAALQQPLSIVSKTPQTTRDALLGVVHHGSAELALLDTPGLHRPRTQLGRVMNEAARDAARRADVVVFVTDVSPRPVKHKEDGTPIEPRPLLPHPGDLVLLADLAPDRPALLVVNKVDLLRDKRHLLPLLEAYGKVRNFDAIVPISAQREDGITLVLDEIARFLPEGPFRYGVDDVTDKPARYFAAEYVREQILRATQDEVPHATAVTIDRYTEPRAPGQAVQIDATIHVERQGQKRILIGAAGAMMKRIGIAARERIEELVGGKVVLRLWVRVTPDWRESLPRLEELGYGKARAGGADAAEYVIVAERDTEADEADDEDAGDEDLDDDGEEDEDRDEEDLDDDGDDEGTPDEDEEE